MQLFLRPFLLIALLAALAAGLTACGGDDGGEAATTQDVNSLLEETFSGDKDVKSGRIDLKASVDVQGGGDDGSIAFELNGPFEDQGDNLPKLDLDVSVEGQGMSFTGGVTSTGEKGFVNFQGTEYAVSDEVFQQVQQAYSEAQKQAEGQEDVSLQSLGLDPRKWLTDPKNEGEAKVGDADTVKITGGVDVAKLLDDVNTALSKAGELGLQGQAEIPTQLTEEQRRQVQEAVKDVRVEIYTGAEDKILRRMVVNLNVDAGEDGAGAISFDLQLLDVNEGQEIEEPGDAKPFEDLVGQLGGLGGLFGGAGGGGTTGGSGGGGGDASGVQPDAETQQQFEDFTRCLEEAGSDQAAAQKCSELIAP